MLEKNSKLPDPDHPRILPFLVKLDIRHQTLDIRLDPDHPCILPFLVQDKVSGPSLHPSFPGSKKILSTRSCPSLHPSFPGSDKLYHAVKKILKEKLPFLNPTPARFPSQHLIIFNTLPTPKTLTLQKINTQY
ncbi:MAG: hypothetical protein ACI35Z_14295 [Sphingobacterium hotanense]